MRKLFEFIRSIYVVVLFVALEVAASGAQIYELGKTVAALDRAVRQIAEARLFSPVECAEAQELVGRIRNALPAACAAGLAAALSHDSE